MGSCKLFPEGGKGAGKEQVSELAIKFDVCLCHEGRHFVCEEWWKQDVKGCKWERCAAEIEKCQHSPQSPDHQLHHACSQAMPAARNADECEIRHININEVHYSSAFPAKARLRRILDVSLVMLLHFCIIYLLQQAHFEDHLLSSGTL